YCTILFIPFVITVEELLHVTDTLPYKALKYKQVLYLRFLFDLILCTGRLVFIELFNLLFGQCYLFITCQFLIGLVFLQLETFKVAFIPIERDVKTFGSLSKNWEKCTSYNIGYR